MLQMHYSMQLEQVTQIDLNRTSIKFELKNQFQVPRKSGVNGNVAGNGLAIGCAMIISSDRESGNRS
jgi:hypothetical protein